MPPGPGPPAFPTGQTDLPRGGVRLTLEIGDMTELATWVLGFGETAKVVEPPDLVDRIKRELEGALAHYAEDGDGAGAKAKKKA